MRSLFIFSIVFILFLSCGTSKDIVPSIVDSPPIVFEKDDREINITVDNPTGYDVYIEGNIEKRIGKKSNNNIVTLLIEDGPLSSGFNIFYEMPLSHSVSLFYKGDHKTFRENRVSFTIEEPHQIENYGTFITLHNRAKNAVRFLTGETNSSLVQTGSPKIGNIWARSNKWEFDPNETEVFKIDYNSSHSNYFIQDGSKKIQLVLPQNVNNNYVYKFEYNGTTVTLTDSRPLHRIGEDAWIEPTKATVVAPPETETDPIELVATNDAIHVFASTESGLLRTAYDSAKNVINSSLSERIPYFTFAGVAEGGFLVAGYEKFTNGTYRPIARIQNMNGATLCALAHSKEYDNERFFTAAQKDSTTWLLAGDGVKIGKGGNTAYVRLVRLEKDELKTVWERGENDFKGDKPLINGRTECGRIISAVYDNVQDRWLVVGGNNSNRNPGSFVAVIANDGAITAIDHSDMFFYKILIASDGAYLIGEEQVKNETYAILAKYNIKDRSFTRIFISPPPHSHSYYHDALIDSTNNLIVLGGVIRAEDGSGRGGVPFVEAVNNQTGRLIWREELSDPEIKKTGAVLVTAIVPAPDYGFALALSGIVNGDYGMPFIIARVNSQGKYYMEERK